MNEDGRRKVLISIIDNIQPSEAAADMILRMFDAAPPPPNPLGRPLITHFEGARPPTARRRGGGPGRLSTHQPAPKIDIKPEAYYTMEIAQAATGYTRQSLQKILSDDPKRLRSKQEATTNRRLLLGEDLLTLREERLGLIAERQADPLASQDEEDDEDDEEEATE